MGSKNSKRRTYLKRIGTAASGLVVALSGCGGVQENETPTETPDSGVQVPTQAPTAESEQRSTKQEQTTANEELTNVQFTSAKVNTTTPMYLYGLQHDAWEKSNISLSINLAEGGEVPEDIFKSVGAAESEVGEEPTRFFINNFNTARSSGLSPPRIAGRAVVWIQRLFARAADDSIGDPTHLDGKVIGVVRIDSLRTKILRDMILEAHGFDIIRDSKEIVQADRTDLWNRLLEGEIDAISGYLRWTTNPDKVKTIFDTHSYWENKTGDPAPATHYIARRDWIRNNASILLDYFEGVRESYRLFNENTDEALQNYGELQGETLSEATKEDWKRSITVMSDEYRPLMNQEMVDNDYQFMEQLLDIGLINNLPGKSELFMNGSQIRELAGGSS